jgi:hypothetical protein
MPCMHRLPALARTCGNEGLQKAEAELHRCIRPVMKSIRRSFVDTTGGLKVLVSSQLPSLCCLEHGQRADSAESMVQVAHVSSERLYGGTCGKRQFPTKMLHIGSSCLLFIKAASAARPQAMMRANMFPRLQSKKRWTDR